MKVKRLDGYEPDYPKKSGTAVKAGLLAAAAAVAAGSMIGCGLSGAAEVDESQTMSEQSIVTPAPDKPELMGELAVDYAGSFTENPSVDLPEETPDEVELMGDIAISPEELP